MKWKPSRSVIENARSVLPKLVEKYFKAGRRAADGKRSPDELHQFRIKTKRFRYTLEEGEGLIQNDRTLLHGVTPISVAAGAPRGIRDIIGLDITVKQGTP